MVYSNDCSKAVVSVLVLLFGALWFILRGDLLYVLPCAILFLCFSVLWALRLPCLGKRGLILVLFVCLIACLDLSVSPSSWCLGKDCSLWLWHSWTFLLPFLLFVALWFKVRGDLFYVLLCVILFLCVSVLLALNLPGLGKKKLILVLFVRLFDFCLFGFVGFLFLLVSGRGCGLWLWRSLGFSLTLFYYSLIVDLRVYVLVKFLFWIDVWPISWQKCPFGFLFVVFWLWCRCFNCVRLSLWCLKRRMFDVRIVSIPDHCLSFDLRPNQRSHVEPVSFTWPLLSWAVLVLKEVNQYLCKFLCQKLTSTLFWMSKWERMT